MLALLSVLADANSHTATPPSSGIGLPIIIAVLAVVLIGGWIMWRVFSGRTRTAVAENLEDTPGPARFQREAGSGAERRLPTGERERDRGRT